MKTITVSDEVWEYLTHLRIRLGVKTMSNTLEFIITNQKEVKECKRG